MYGKHLQYNSYITFQNINNIYVTDGILSYE